MGNRFWPGNHSHSIAEIPGETCCLERLACRCNALVCEYIGKRFARLLLRCNESGQCHVFTHMDIEVCGIPDITGGRINSDQPYPVVSHIIEGVCSFEVGRSLCKAAISKIPDIGFSISDSIPENYCERYTT